MAVPVTRSVLPENMQQAVDQTVAAMLSMAHGQYGAKSAIIREHALKIIHAARLADRDYYGMIQAIGKWVRDNVRYVLDTVGQETISHPEYLLQTLGGDCDDVTTLLIALLGSVGIDAWPVVVGTAPGMYEHVYAEARVPEGASMYSGKVVPIDAIMKHWQIGQVIPPAKVKIRKSYEQEAKMAGYGPLNGLGAYAVGPSYLQASGSGDIAHALSAAATPAGSMATVPYVTEVQAPSDNLDAMILASPEQIPGPQLGPSNQAEASGATVVLPSATDAVLPELGGRRTRRPQRKHAIVDGRLPFVGGGTPRKTPPSANEVRGLASLLGALEALVQRTGCNRWSGVHGAADPLPLCSAAACLAGAYDRRGAAFARGMSGQDLNILGALRQRAEALAGAAAGGDSARRQYLASTRLAGLTLERSGQLTSLFDRLPSPEAAALPATKARALAIADAARQMPKPVDRALPTPKITALPAGAQVLLRRM